MPLATGFHNGLYANSTLKNDANERVKEAGLQYQSKTEMRYMVGVLIEDFGYAELGKHVVKPLEGVKFASYVGCQTNRPFGINGGSSKIRFTSTSW